MQKYQNNVQTLDGRAIVGASVTVTEFPGGAPATVYNSNGSGVITQPILTNGDGEFAFYAANGRYQLSVTGGGISVAQTITDVILFDPVDAGLTADLIALGADPTGANDSTSIIQSALDNNDVVDSGEGTFRISSTLKFKRPGQVLRGAGKINTKFVNSDNSSPLFSFGDISLSSGFAPFSSISDVGFVGNAATTAGIIIYGGPATANPSWTDASKDCSLENVKIDNVGAGYALEIHSWENILNNVTIGITNKCLRGVLFIDEAQQNETNSLYITGCDEQSIKFDGSGTKICRGNVLVSTVVQQSGGASGVIDIEDAETTTFVGLYSESNNTKGAPRIVFARGGSTGTNITNVVHLSGGAVVVRNEGFGTTIDGVSSSDVTGNIIENAGAGTINLGSVEWLPGVVPTGGKFSDLSVGGRATYLDQVYYGKWTPTITPVTNVDATTAFECQFSRVGNVVTFSGQVNIDPTAASATEIGVSLPIASNFSATRHAAGTYSSNSTTLKDGGCIFADSTNDRLTFRHVAGGTANLSFFFSGSYLII